MLDTPRSMLLELAKHLKFDSRNNNSAPPNHHFGCLVLDDTENSLWSRACNVMGQDDSTENEILEKILDMLSRSAEGRRDSGYSIGTFYLLSSETSLWQRTLKVLNVKTDMIRDFEAPAIKERLRRKVA